MSPVRRIANPILVGCGPISHVWHGQISHVWHGQVSHVWHGPISTEAREDGLRADRRRTSERRIGTVEGLETLENLGSMNIEGLQGAGPKGRAGCGPSASFGAPWRPAGGLA